MKDGAVTENSIGIGTVTRKMVRVRAVELALINGRAPQETSKADWEQAKRELTAGSNGGSKEAMTESTPETERWNPVPGVRMNWLVSAAPSADENEDGRGDNERLANEGMAGAEHDQSRQAAPE